MDFLGARIQIKPRPTQPVKAVLAVGLLGHCPGKACPECLIALPNALAEIRKAGFGLRVDAIVQALDSELYHLPIPLASSAEFDAIFPEARTLATQYESVLAGDRAWLPIAIDDFFANGGQTLWVVRVPESEGARGFVPNRPQPLHDTENLTGINCLLVLNNLGLVALPDLERLQIPAQLPDIPRKRLLNPEPRFLPAGTNVNEGARERRTSAELQLEQSPLPSIALLGDILGCINKYRPDVQCLLSLPLAYSSSMESPCADPEVLTALNQVRVQENAYRLRQLQLLFPYLNNGERLTSPVGVVAGAIAGSAARKGIWRSIGAVPLRSMGRPYPVVNMQQTVALREAPGVGVLTLRQGILQLDDERILVPALQRDDYSAELAAATGSYSERLNGLRSAEVVRFLGYLARELRELGESLIFNLDPNDPRPRLVLQDFFLRLYRAGALRGRTAADAFSISPAERGESTIAFNIEIAPAYPVDKILLTFVNRNGEWTGGLSGLAGASSHG